MGDALEETSVERATLSAQSFILTGEILRSAVYLIVRCEVETHTWVKADLSCELCDYWWEAHL